jgi:hypothetical protein
MEKRKTIKIRNFVPRNNFPAHIAGKRKESLFVIAFTRAYQELNNDSTCLLARELPMNGYGIADLVSLEHSKRRKLSVKSKPRTYIIAFEMKIADWKAAIPQAFRYRFFSNRSIVVLPSEEAERAKRFIQTFRVLHVGLWAFDKRTRNICKIYTPPIMNPLTTSARQKAIAILASHL